MAFRTKNTYTNSRGTYNTRKKTFTGRGGAPAGYTKVPTRSVDEVSVTTRLPSGRVVRSGPRPASVAPLPSVLSNPLGLLEVNDLLTPGPTARENAEAAVRLGVKPKRDGPDLPDLPDIGKAAGTAVRSFVEGVNDIAKEAKEAAALPTKRVDNVLGRKTLGKPTLAQLLRASNKGQLRINQRGKITIPGTRGAARDLAAAKRLYRRTARPNLSGLSPAEREVAIYAQKAHRKYPDIPVSLLMSLTRQESGFQADAVSSANAQGLTQFIPSTAAAYGVQYGTGRREKQSQLTGAARLLHANDFASDPKGALTNYTGGYSDAEYNDPVLQGSADYAALDRPSKPTPRAEAELSKAVAQARRLGIPTAARLGSKGGGLAPAPQTRKTPTIVQVGLIAQNKFGLQVGEHPAFGGVEPVHTGGSYHYEGQAIDVSGDPAKLAAFNKFVATRFGDQLAEMFYDPGINIDSGQPTSPIGGHGTHVHVAIDEPGTEAHGLVTGSYGLSSSQPVGYYGMGGTPEAAQKSAQRAKQAVIASVSDIASPTAASAPLPEMFSQFQLGVEGEDEAKSGLGVIEGLLRRKRL